jgi:hypothetical protein
MSIFKSKKRKADEAELAKLKEAGEGQYKTTARRATDASGKTLKRKTTVTMKKKEVNAGYKTETSPDTKVEGKTTTKFVAGDYNPNKVVDRPTTPELIRKLKESPAKGGARMQAQKEGKTSYLYKGKHEYSGRKETTKEPDTIIKGTTTRTPVKKTVTETSYHRPEKSGLSIRKRRISGGTQNKMQADIVLSKKTKKLDKYGDPVLKKKSAMLFRYNTKTKGTKSKRTRE